MIEFISGEDFRFLWLPIATIILTVLLKILCKHRSTPITGEFFAVGPNLMVTSLFIILIKMSLLAQAIKIDRSSAESLMDDCFSMMLVFAALLLGMLAMSWILHEKGWRRKEIDSIQMRKWAIFWSDLGGVVYLIISYNF